jgi:hypothetical protein
LVLALAGKALLLITDHRRLLDFQQSIINFAFLKDWGLGRIEAIHQSVEWLCCTPDLKEYNKPFLIPKSKDMPKPNLRKAFPGNARYGPKTGNLTYHI